MLEKFKIALRGIFLIKFLSERIKSIIDIAKRILRKVRQKILTTFVYELLFCSRRAKPSCTSFRVRKLICFGK